jgi:hypothetical protein
VLPAIKTERRAGVFSIAILGADCVLAALPATPVQLTHACLEAGYDLAVPATWGDELIAAECLGQLADRGARPAIMCACPHVREELLDVGADLAPMLVSLVSPPVAAARYLHALYGRERVHLTYIGACPSGTNEAIDAHATPAEFLASVASAGISLTDQPKVFDSVLPPDRRRFFSVAGGVPSAEQLWSAGNGRSLVELDGEDYLIDLAQHLLSHECALIDLAPRLGCACSGASPAIPARSARAAVAVVDPPRAASPVLDVVAALDLNEPIDFTPAVAEVEAIDTAVTTTGAGGIGDVRGYDRTAPPTRANGGNGASPSAPPRRHSPVTGIRSIQRSVPVAHVAGRRLPRAYVGARRPAAATPDSAANEPPVSRIPPAAGPDAAGEDNGRTRPAARVAASPRSSGQATPAAAIAAGASGAPERMSDGPRS